MMTRKLRSIVVIVVFIAICAAFLIPWHIDRSLTAFEVNLANRSIIGCRDISITGEYCINCFTSDVFEGSFSISGYPITAQNTCFRIERNGYPLIYVLEDNSSYSVGSIVSGRFFRHMYIMVNEHPDSSRLDRASFDERTGTVLFPNYDSLEDALSVWDDRE